MKKISNISGLTLVELIVSSVLMSIVLLGIVAFNTSIKQIQNSTNYNNSANFQASVAMSYIRNDVAVATGDPIDPGIITNTSGSNTSLCLRQPDATTSDWSDNVWNCYLYEDASHNLVRCLDIPTGTTVDALSDCTGETQFLARLDNGNFFDNPYTQGTPIRITLNIFQPNPSSTPYTYESIIKPNQTQD